MVYKISENQFNAQKLQKFESIACQGNGYIGVRNSLEEEYVNTHRNMFINGVLYDVPASQIVCSDGNIEL